MTVSFREIADQCDAFDKEVEDISNARKEFWAEVREVIPARDVKALKAAIKARRKRRADPEGEEALEQRTIEILRDIIDDVGSDDGSSGTSLATRARAPRETREVIQGEVGREFTNETTPHDPSTGELIEIEHVDAGDIGDGLTMIAPVDFSDNSRSIEPASVPSETEAGQEGVSERTAGDELGPKTSSVAPPPIATNTSDADLPRASDGCPTKQEMDDPIASEGASARDITGKSSDPSRNFDDLEPPPFLKRGDPACAARSP